MELSEAFRAGTWGFLSAVSLPLGAAMGLRFNPSHKWTSVLMAFGAGALISALTLELVASSLHHAGYGVMASGFLFGSVVYLGFNEVLNNKGGFLRKLSTTVGYLSGKKREQVETIIDRLSRVEILRALPPDEVENVVPSARPAAFKAGDVLCAQGDPGDRLFLIEAGQAEVERSGQRIAVLGPGDVFGEMALLTGEPRSATVRAASALSAWTIAKEDFERLIEESPRLKREVDALLERRSKGGPAPAERGAADWAKEAKKSIAPGDLAVNSEDILKAEAHGGAPLAIWLGILLDGVPESLVIGATMIGGAGVNPALFVGVFLADFPEAMSSAVGMRRQGMSPLKVMWMWTSLALMMGVGAGIGILTFGSVSPQVHGFIESMAAGAMLTVIADTMLPEAVEQGGPMPGLMSVLGFLAAVYAGTFGAH